MSTFKLHTTQWTAFSLDRALNSVSFLKDCITGREASSSLQVAQIQAIQEWWCAKAAVFFSPPGLRWTLPGHSNNQGLCLYSLSSTKLLIFAVNSDFAVNTCSGQQKAKSVLVAQTTKCLFYYCPLNIVFNQVELLQGCLTSACVPAVQ